MGFLDKDVKQTLHDEPSLPLKSIYVVKKKTAVLLVNLGSPNSPKPRDVFRYLIEFLNDPRVIDINWLGQKLLVNGIIVPFRYRNSAKLYSQLWTENGSPLIHYGERLCTLLQERFNNHPHSDVKFFLGMRYQHPSLEQALTDIRKWNPDKILIVPLFPQYASSTSGSIIDKCMRMMRDFWAFQDVEFIAQFWDHPLYIQAFVERGKEFDLKKYDHILFSFHGLPVRQLDKVHEDGKCSNHPCATEVNDENKLCYKATCYATARAIASGLGIDESHYTVAFQSRLGSGWIEPFSDNVITNLAQQGKKNILAFSPAFIADCLETTIEIGDEYQELFHKHGGEKVQLVPSLNDSPTWIKAMDDIIRKRVL